MKAQNKTVHIIKPTIGTEAERMIRVAAYCRVSTDSEDQANSFLAQVRYYSDFIQSQENMILVDIYADEGITGTCMNKREDFKRLIYDCSINDEALMIKARRSSTKTELPGITQLIKSKLYCSVCGKHYNRKNKWKTREKWLCSGGCKCGVYMDDTTIFDGIQLAIENAVSQKQTTTYQGQASYQPTIEITLRNNETRRIMEQPKCNFKIVADAIMKCASEKYACCEILCHTELTKEILSSYIKTTVLDEKLIERKTNNGELAKYLITNNHPAIVDRDTYNAVQMELAARNSKSKKSEGGITERGKYSSKYALTDVLICGCCGSYYRRTGKTVKGKVQHVWRCIGRIEHRCKDAVGIEETKLHTAICKCLSQMMNHREDVINLCRTNLQYALTGDTQVLDMFAIENQIEHNQDLIDDLMEKAEKTTGDPERYEREIVKLYEQIAVLRDQLKLAKKQVEQNVSVSAEIERFTKAVQEYDNADFTEYNDVMIRRLVECIRVMPDRSIEVVLKDGIKSKCFV